MWPPNTLASLAASLARRGTDELDFEESIDLWSHYLQAALKNTQGCRRLILRYEDYFIDTDHQIKRLADFVCGPDAQLGNDTYERIESFIEPELWHNRDSIAETNRVRAISLEAADLYVRLSTQAAADQAASAHDVNRQSLLAGWSVSRVWWLALILSSIVAMADVMLTHVILIPLLALGPFCPLLTGRWIRTATVAIWTITLGVFLGLPDEIWGTSVQMVYLGFIAATSLMSVSAATVIEKGRW